MGSINYFYDGIKITILNSVYFHFIDIVFYEKKHSRKKFAYLEKKKGTSLVKSLE